MNKNPSIDLTSITHSLKLDFTDTAQKYEEKLTNIMNACSEMKSDQTDTILASILEIQARLSEFENLMQEELSNYNIANLHTILSCLSRIKDRGYFQYFKNRGYNSSTIIKKIAEYMVKEPESK